MLQVRKVIAREEFLSELEISLATFKRDLEFLRSRFQVNIEWDRERGGYYCDDLRSGRDRREEVERDRQPDRSASEHFPHQHPVGDLPSRSTDVGDRLGLRDLHRGEVYDGDGAQPGEQ